MAQEKDFLQGNRQAYYLGIPTYRPGELYDEGTICTVQIEENSFKI